MFVKSFIRFNVLSTIIRPEIIRNFVVSTLINIKSKFVINCNKMASIVRRHPAAHAHAHFRRVKPNAKPETTLAQASP